MAKLLACGVSRYGFVSNKLRARVWPVLLGLDTVQPSEDSRVTTASESGYPKRNRVGLMKDKSIISGDVERSFLGVKECDESARTELRAKLHSLLNDLIERNPNIHYYQGLHDIASGFLFVLDPALALRATEVVCTYYIKYLSHTQKPFHPDLVFP